MTDPERVIRAFRALRKAGDAIELAQCRHTFATTRQNFVRVGLVANIPDQSVFWRIKHRMQSDRQFHRAEVG